MECQHCKKTFKAKHCYNYHLQNKVCQKHTRFICQICNKSFSSKSNLNRHLTQKTMCAKTLNMTVAMTPTDSVLTPNDSVLTPKKYECNICKKVYSKNSNLRRHETKCHKKIEIRQIEYQNEYIEKIEKLELKIKELETYKLNNTVINNTYIKNETNNNNIKINNYGSEDISTISHQEMYNIVNKCYSALKLLTKRTHIDIAENRNIYVPSYKDSHVLVYNNGEWQYNDLRKVLEEVINNNIDRINTFYDDNMDNYSLSRQSYISQMIDESLKGDVDTKYMKDLKLLFLNNRKIIKKHVLHNV